MTTSQILKSLAKGINPDTGKELDSNCVAKTLEAIKILKSLSDELYILEVNREQEIIFSSKEKESKNISEGKPARSGFPWPTEDKIGLAEDFKAGVSIEGMAEEHERSPLAIAQQLKNLKLIDNETAMQYWEKADFLIKEIEVLLKSNVYKC